MDMTDLAPEIFSALGDPTRRRLFETLARSGEMNVRALTAEARVSQPMVSRHLAILRSAGLVVDRRHGREHHYKICPEGLGPVTHWVSDQTAFWNNRFDALSDLLERIDN
jgi:DNA-binding transcriptional ArsR family regulator